MEEKNKIKALTIKIDSALHDKFKSVAAAKGENMTTVLVDKIKEYLEEQNEN